MVALCKKLRRSLASFSRIRREDVLLVSTVAAGAATAAGFDSPRAMLDELQCQSLACTHCRCGLLLSMSRGRR
jgi:hypothetical protein